MNFGTTVHIFFLQHLCNRQEKKYRNKLILILVFLIQYDYSYITQRVTVQLEESCSVRYREIIYITYRNYFPKLTSN